MAVQKAHGVRIQIWQPQGYQYIDNRDEVMKDEMKDFSRTEDQKLTQKIKEGDKFKSIHTKNMLDLKSGDFITGAAQFNVFLFSEGRDLTQKYHK